MFWLAVGNILRSWALAMQGHAEVGIAQLRAYLEAYELSGAKLLHPYFLTLLAEAYGQAGHPESGLSVLDTALTQIETTGERAWESGIYWLQGKLQLQQEAPDTLTAESCFQIALKRRAGPAGQISRATGGNKPQSTVATTGQAGGSPRSPRSNP